MIILYHKYNKVHSIWDSESQSVIDTYKDERHLNVLMDLAASNSDCILVWCHLDYKENLNTEWIRQSLHLKNRMVSFSPTSYLPPQIGYVEDSPFINVNMAVTYPTWQMSSAVGAIYCNQLLKFKNVITSNNLDYSLNSIAKLGMPKGLFCYSEPRLLDKTDISVKQAGSFTLFKFVKQHYRTRWVFLLALNYFWHERRVMLWPLFRSLFYKKKKFDISINIETSILKNITRLPSIDVIIPTIGREPYLHQVLKDLALQTHLPKQVIVVEQNPDFNGKRGLGFINSQTWPFKIIHHFTHQTGVCNARNVAMNHIDSDYVFMADDDIRFSSYFLEQALETILGYKFNATTFSCLQDGEEEKIKQFMQWPTFGSGCSIIKSDFLKQVSFNMALEFGFGEDVDFGMQLRNLGVDVIYIPEIKISHLKAPIGGFRSTYKPSWIDGEIQPKPSPTVMLNRLNNSSKHQLLGYKTLLLIKYYFAQTIKNPMRYYKQFTRQWNQSVFLANELNRRNK